MNGYLYSVTYKNIKTFFFDLFLGCENVRYNSPDFFTRLDRPCNEPKSKNCDPN